MSYRWPCHNTTARSTATHNTSRHASAPFHTSAPRARQLPTPTKIGLGYRSVLAAYAFLGMDPAAAYTYADFQAFRNAAAFEHNGKPSMYAFAQKKDVLQPLFGDHLKTHGCEQVPPLAQLYGLSKTPISTAAVGGPSLGSSEPSAPQTVSQACSVRREKKASQAPAPVQALRTAPRRKVPLRDPERARQRLAEFRQLAEAASASTKLAEDWLRENCIEDFKLKLENVLKAVSAHQREKRWLAVMEDYQQARRSANRAKASLGKGLRAAEINSRLNSRLSSFKANMLEYTQLLLDQGKKSAHGERLDPGIFIPLPIIF